MAPGPMTAATIIKGTNNRFAGTFISIGHGIVEIPLIFILMFGIHFIFQLNAVKILIGLFGGAFLLWMAFGLLKLKDLQGDKDGHLKNNSITIGIMLSATNPYFLLWWATVGLNLALGAKQIGIIALILFAVVHWLCDFIWLSFLSFGAYYGNKQARLFSSHFQKRIIIFCGAALMIFGLKFIYDALSLWML
jgi:threonine/homoserine/homoserine lactone efflux protein